MIVALLAAFLLLGIGVKSSSAADLRYRPARIDSPLKGVIAETPSKNESFPHTLRYVRISLSRLMKGPNEIDWTALDQALQLIAAGGRQAVIRIYIDWPGLQSGIPGFLLEGKLRTNQPAAWRRNYHPPPIVPDYDDPNLRTAIKNFIAAFGHRYDGKAEIGFIEAGLLGVWGEWLPWADSAPSTEAQRETIQAYLNAFSTTKILFRFPSEPTIEHRVGYHDDWFKGASDDFTSRFAQLGISEPAFWQTEPSGGRIFPDVQRRLWRSQAQFKLDAAFLQGIRSQHLTYLRLGASFHNVRLFDATDAVLEVAQVLGYELFVSAARIEQTQPAGLTEVSIAITNTGSAPFYYPWPVELSLSRGGTVTLTSRTDWDLRTVIPGKETARFTHRVDHQRVAPGEYEVLVRVVNPLSNGFLLSFANEGQDSSIPGWLTLGTTTLAP